MPHQRNGPVIVVEDDEAVRNSLKFALELEGLEVRLYRSGLELLAEEHLEACGCLVVDDEMPGLSGCELIQELRNREVKCPAILIAATVSNALLTRAKRCGARCVLAKPLEDDILLREIATALH